MEKRLLGVEELGQYLGSWPKPSATLSEAKNKEHAFGDDWSSSLTLVEKMGLDPWRGTVVRIRISLTSLELGEVGKS